MPLQDRFLSAHFTLYEMLTSETAARFQFDEQYEPSPKIVQNLELLCENVLEPLRMTLNMPIRVNSGYRCPRVNSMVGGASNSQHLLGQAADIVILNPGVSVEELFQRIRVTTLPFDQVIQEFNRWVHISFRANPRGSVLRATKSPEGKTVYTKVEPLAVPAPIG